MGESEILDKNINLKSIKLLLSISVQYRKF